MLRAFLCSAVVLALCAWVQAADKPHKDKDARDRKHRQEATITKVNPRNGTLTVRMKNKQGKEVERTFHLTEDVEYLDSTGRVAALDVFQSGDYVLVLEEEGRLKEVKKADQGHQGNKTHKNHKLGQQPNKGGAARNPAEK